MKTKQFLVVLTVVVLGAGTPQCSAQGLPQPTPEHKAMAREAGNWKAVSKLWLTPETEPMISEASESNALLGELWLLSEYEGNVMGMPFKGMGTMGYDPVKKKYVGTWVDTINPHLQTMEGEYDVATHTLTMYSTGRDVMTSEEKTSKLVSRYLDDNSKVFEMHALVPGKTDEYWKQMEVTYKRAD